jgi:hypothetical protein
MSEQQSTLESKSAKVPADKDQQELNDLSLVTLKSRYSIYAVFLKVFFILIISAAVAEFALLFIKPIGKNTTLNFPSAIDFSFSPDGKSFLALIEDSNGLILLSKDTGNTKFEHVVSHPEGMTTALSPLVYDWESKTGIVLADNSLFVKSNVDSPWDSISVYNGPFVYSVFSSDRNKIFLLAESDSVFVYDIASRVLTFEGINDQSALTFSVASIKSANEIFPETFRLVRTATGIKFFHERIFEKEINKNDFSAYTDSAVAMPAAAMK